MQRPRPGDWAHRFEYWLRRASARNTLSTAGFRWTVHSANMVKTVRSLERSDPLMGAFFRDASEADVFLDIGANFGVWTIPAAAGAPRLGHVIAIEPAPGPYWCLLKNLRLNNCADRCTPVAVAAGDHVGTTVFRIDTLDPGTGTSHVWSGDSAVHEPTGALWSPEPIDIVVPLFTVDALIAAVGSPRPTMVKIDVEGHEGAVLSGMQHTIRDVRRLFVEIHPDRLPPGLSATRLLEAIGAHGFSVRECQQRGRQLHALCDRPHA